MDRAAVAPTAHFSCNGKYVFDRFPTLPFRFCPKCGSTVYWTGDSFPGLVVVAIGTFADPSFPAPAISVWEESPPSYPPPKRVAKQG